MSQQESALNVAVEDPGVATIEIDRPPLNLFTFALLAELTDVIASLSNDPTCRAIVLCSTGKHFCAGADLANMSGIGPDGRHIYDVARGLFDCDVPIVAAVQGSAVGGGLGLALLADFRVAANDAKFVANFAALGFHPGFGISATLPHLVGQRSAAQILYGGESVTADEAARIGLCDLVVSPEQLRASTSAMAHTIAAQAPLAVRAIRRTLRATLRAHVGEALQHERAEQDRLMTTRDFHEGVAAARERRTPRFRGE